MAVTSQQTSAEALKQMDLLAEDLFADQERLHRVHWQIATRSTDLCSRLTQASGMHTAVLPKGGMADSMSRLYGITALPTVVTVAPGSPAEKAGIKPRDVVLSVWGIPSSIQDQKPIQEQGRTAKAGEPMPMQVRRNGEIVDLTLQPVTACDYPATVVPAQALNAFADGERIFITRGMMAFARSDDELALVVAHEMAHNTMRHLDAKKVNATVGLVAGVALILLTRGAYSGTSIANAAASAYSQEFEAEADYVGLYMLANSGYSVQDAPKFWRRMATAHPASIKDSHTASHPATSYRMVALEETAKEIEGKRVATAALVPVRKDGKPFKAGEGLLAVSAPTSSGSRGQQAFGGGVASAGPQKEVVGCVPIGTRAGDRIALRDWGVVDVKSLSNNNTECGANGATISSVTATFVPVGGR